MGPLEEEESLLGKKRRGGGPSNFGGRKYDHTTCRRKTVERRQGDEKGEEVGITQS